MRGEAPLHELADDALGCAVGGGDRIIAAVGGLVVDSQAAAEMREDRLSGRIGQFVREVEKRSG